MLKIEASYYWCTSYYDPENPIGRITDDENPKEINRDADRVSVSVRSYEPNHELALSKLCAAFGLEENELAYIQENLSVANWALLRVDDNGNEVEVFRYHDRFCAEYVRDSYAAKGHKQAYFVRCIESEST